MKIVAIVCGVILGATPIVSAAQSPVAQDTVRPSPNETSLSLVLTPQGIDRLVPPMRSEAQAPLRSELEAPGWSRAQSLALLWTTTIACAAMGSRCAPMPPAPTLATPPGSESWQRVGCKTPETCGWLWVPAIKGPYLGPQQ